MSTRSEVLELSQSVELKLVSSSQEWTLPLPQPMSRVTLNQLKCITNLSLKLFPETTSDLTLKASQLRTSREDMLPETQRTIPQDKLNLSLLKSSLWTTPDKSKTDIPQFWIATLPTLLASSRKLQLKLTEELVNQPNKNPNSWKTETQLLLSWNPASHFVVKASPNIPHSEDSLSEIWNRPLLSESLRPPPRKTLNEMIVNKIILNIFHFNDLDINLIIKICNKAIIL